MTQRVSGHEEMLSLAPLSGCRGEVQETLWCDVPGLMPVMRGAGEDEAHEPCGPREVPGQEGQAGARAAGAQDGQDRVQIVAAAQECTEKCESDEVWSC